jgi:hypothetical protein
MILLRFVASQSLEFSVRLTFLHAVRSRGLCWVLRPDTAIAAATQVIPNVYVKSIAKDRNAEFGEYAVGPKNISDRLLINLPSQLVRHLVGSQNARCERENADRAEGV